MNDNSCITSTNDCVQYLGLKIRFAKLYSWLDTFKGQEIDCISQICAFMSTHLESISGTVSGTFETVGKGVSLESGMYGSYIGFPRLTFKLPNCGLDFECTIRINPCTLHPDSSTNMHYSKIWVNLNPFEQFRMDGKNMKELRRETRQVCGTLAESIGHIYGLSCADLVNCSMPGSDDPYWVSIESALIAPEEFDEEVAESLFAFKDRERFLNSYQKSPVTRRAMADVAEWVYDTDVDNPLKFIKDNKDENTEWKVGMSPEARVLYVQRNTDSFFEIVGIGQTWPPSDNIRMVDKIFLPMVSGLIAAL